MVGFGACADKFKPQYPINIDMDCLKCGGMMNPGVIMVTDLTPLGKGSLDGIMSIPGTTMPTGSGRMHDAEMTWKEKTGEKTGWIFKRDKEIIKKVTGYRCTRCGYIELYASI